jgi:peptidyl-prolyl cis-trans isomerase C
MQLRKCFLLLVFASAAFAQLPLKRDPSTVVATVEGRNVTWGEVQQILAAAGPQFNSLFQQSPEAALMQWFMIQHLAKEGAEMKLDQQSPWKEQIESMRNTMLADARMNQEFNGHPVKNEELQAFYDKNKSRFQRVRVSGIFVKFKPETKAGATSPQDVAAAAAAILQGAGVQRSEADAKTLAADLVKRLRAGEPMASLVTQYSEDEATKTKGGDLGFITSTSGMPPEIVKAAMPLQEGQVSEPVRLAAGYFILRADERGFQPLSEASGDILEEIRKAHQDEFLKTLNTRFRPVIKDPTLIIPTQPQPARAK